MKDITIILKDVPDDLYKNLCDHMASVFLERSGFKNIPSFPDVMEIDFDFEKNTSYDREEVIHSLISNTFALYLGDLEQKNEQEF